MIIEVFFCHSPSALVTASAKSKSSPDERFVDVPVGDREVPWADCSSLLPSLAYAEMRLMLARLLWKFYLEIMPDSIGWDKQKVYVLWEKGDLNVKITEVSR